MNLPNAGKDDVHLDALFQAYREACPDSEPSANFMPQLWGRIEARRRYSTFFGRLAGGFVTAAVVASLAMAFYLATPRRSSAFYSESYIEALASAKTHSVESVEADIARFEALPPEQ